MPQPSYSSYTICPDISELGAVFTVKRIGVDLWSQRCTRGYRRSMATAQELMTSPADCLNEADSITQAASALARADVGSMPVTGDADQLVGLLTDRDIVVRVLAEGRDVEETTVGDVMTSDMVTVSPDANNEQVLAALSDNQIRRVPVVSNGKVVGMISQADVARDLSNKDTGDVVEAISRD